MQEVAHMVIVFGGGFLSILGYALLMLWEEWMDNREPKVRKAKKPAAQTAPAPRIPTPAELAFEKDWEERAKPAPAPKATVMAFKGRVIGVYGYDEDESAPGWQPL